MNRASSLIQLCESSKIPLTSLPKVLPKTKEAWKTFILAALGKTSSKEEERFTGDYSAHFIYDMDFMLSTKSFAEALREISKTGYYFELDHSVGDSIITELYYSCKKDVATLQKAAETESRGTSFGSVASRAESAIMSAYSNAGDTLGHKVSRYGSLEFDPQFHQIAWGSISASLEDDLELSKWFKKHGYTW